MANSLVKKEDRPTLKDVLYEIGPFPYEAIFLGMAEDDGFPILLNTLSSGQNILIWNGEVGFLKMVADFIMNYQEKKEFEFVVFTNNHEEWEFLSQETNFKKGSPCIGVIPFWSDLANQVLLALAEWIHKDIRPNHSIIILIEGIENVLKMDLDAKQNFNYIFLRGEDRRVFAVGTVPKDLQLFGLEDSFEYKVEFNKKTGKYEFPEGENTIQGWIPKIGE